MTASPFRALNNRSADHEVPRLLMQPDGPLPCSKQPATIPIRSQMSLVYTLTPHSCTIQFNDTPLPTSNSPEDIFPTCLFFSGAAAPSGPGPLYS